MSVKLAKNEHLLCDQMVPQLSWWIQGETFHTPMSVLPLGAYNAILGVDWLKTHGPVTEDWSKKTLRFTNMGNRVTLQAIQSTESISI
jgi:hypothetical protein